MHTTAKHNLHMLCYVMYYTLNDKYVMHFGDDACGWLVQHSEDQTTTISTTNPLWHLHAALGC